jgi:hypothetical protein
LKFFKFYRCKITQGTSPAVTFKRLNVPSYLPIMVNQKIINHEKSKIYQLWVY